MCVRVFSRKKEKRKKKNEDEDKEVKEKRKRRLATELDTTAEKRNSDCKFFCGALDKAVNFHPRYRLSPAEVREIQRDKENERGTGRQELFVCRRKPRDIYYDFNRTLCLFSDCCMKSFIPFVPFFFQWTTFLFFLIFWPPRACLKMPSTFHATNPPLFYTSSHPLLGSGYPKIFHFIHRGQRSIRPLFLRSFKSSRKKFSTPLMTKPSCDRGLEYFFFHHTCLFPRNDEKKKECIHLCICIQNYLKIVIFSCLKCIGHKSGRDETKYRKCFAIDT